MIPSNELHDYLFIQGYEFIVERKGIITKDILTDKLCRILVDINIWHSVSLQRIDDMVESTRDELNNEFNLWKER